MIQNPEERRIAPRFDHRQPVTYQFRHRENQSASLSRDISVSGIRIDAHDFIPVGEELQLAMRIGDATVEGRAKVVWIEQQRYNERFHVGLQFTSPEARAHFKKYFPERFDNT